MKSNKKDIIKRLKTARGHLRRVIKMVEEDKYCIDILQQSLAVQAALRRADEVILADHLTHCVKDALSDKKKDKQLKEILEVFKKGRRL
jgi:DNA-binding FrmR family transcriptional regulator